MSEIFEINMPNAIHAAGVSGISETNSHGALVYVLVNSELPEHQLDVPNKLRSGMSEMSAINVIYVLAMCRMSKKPHPDAWVNVLGNAELPEHQWDVHK